MIDRKGRHFSAQGPHSAVVVKATGIISMQGMFATAASATSLALLFRAGMDKKQLLLWMVSQFPPGR